MYLSSNNLSRFCVSLLSAATLLATLGSTVRAQQLPDASGSVLTPASAAAPGQQQSPSRTPDLELRIGSGDLLEVSIFGSPEYRQEVRVSTAGEISLALVGSVQVSGLTPTQAQQVVHDKLVQGTFYKDPQVSIFVKEYASGGVHVLGEVTRPGFYPLLNVHRLLEAISVAGGTTPRAGRIVNIANPSRPNGGLSVTLSNEANSSKQENVEVLPGDTIVVTKAGIVYVVGDVRMPTGVVMEHGGLTVLQAVAMAQGANSTASLDKAKLIRRSGGDPHEIPIPLKKILAAKSPDVPLQPDDIVFVPGSATKGAAKRGLEAIVQAATGIAIWRPY